jgi:hypothetical protein
VKPREKVYLDGDTVPELETVLCDPRGVTWRVVAVSEGHQAMTLRPTGGAWMTVLRTPAMLHGWEVLP